MVAKVERILSSRPRLIIYYYIYRENLPYEAAFLAGKCFLRYRKSGGVKHAPLPDFYIGAHAAVRGWNILTRDNGRYQPISLHCMSFRRHKKQDLFVPHDVLNYGYSNHTVQAGMPMTANGDTPAP